MEGMDLVKKETTTSKTSMMINLPGNEEDSDIAKIGLDLEREMMLINLDADAIKNTEKGKSNTEKDVPNESNGLNVSQVESQKTPENQTTWEEMTLAKEVSQMEPWLGVEITYA